MTGSIKAVKTVNLAIKYLFLVLFAVIFLFPVSQLILKAFMSDEDIIDGKLFPTAFSFAAFSKAIDAKYLWWLKNTVIIGVVNMFGITLSSSLCAYGFAKLKFKGRDLLFSVVISTLMLPAICMQIPLYKIYYGMQWTNTWAPLIVPGFCGGGALNIFLMRQYMKGIPDSVHSAGLRVKVMLKTRPASSNVTVGAESVRLVQAALSGCWDVSSVWTGFWSSSLR